MKEIVYKELSYEIQGAFFEVYKALGNAFKENIYHSALKQEFATRGLNFESEKRINIYFRSKKVGAYCPDLIIESKVLVEIKAKPILLDLDHQQFWHYLKGSDYKLGYLVNFGSLRKVQFLRRVFETARKVSV